MSKRMLSVVALSAAVLSAGVGRADEVAKQAAKVVKDYAGAVVQIEATLTVRAEGPMADRLGGEREQKVNALGTVIDALGLTVCSQVSLNPTSAMGNIRLPGGQGTVSFTGELSDVKMCLPDGTEIDARVVLTDEDLDLAFVAPKGKLDKQEADNLAAVDLTKSAKAKRLDRVVRLSRLAKDLNRELVVELDRISAIIAKPRLLYVLGGARPGAPVFTPAGKILGVVTFRTKAGGASRRGQSAGLNGIPVVLPAGDVRKIADQAREELEKKAEDADPDEEEKPETKQAGQ